MYTPIHNNPFNCSCLDTINLDNFIYVGVLLYFRQYNNYTGYLKKLTMYVRSNKYCFIPFK